METNGAEVAHYKYFYTHTPQLVLEGFVYSDGILLRSNLGHRFRAINWFDFGSSSEEPHLKKKKRTVDTCPPLQRGEERK